MTPTLTPPAGTVAGTAADERCDRCNAAGKLRLTLAGGSELVFCGHHANRYAEDLVKIISCLPPSSRMVFNLFVIEGYSHKEIAEMLKISEGTSKWHVSFAKEKLKKLLEKQAGTKEVKYEDFK